MMRASNTTACLAPGTAARAQIETAAELLLDLGHQLLALLDEADGDPCAEPEEPDATACEWSGVGAARFNITAEAA